MAESSESVESVGANAIIGIKTEFNILKYGGLHEGDSNDANSYIKVFVYGTAVFIE